MQLEEILYFLFAKMVFEYLDFQYQIAQMYMVMKMQQQNTSSSEGVEVLENRPLEDDVFGQCQYTSKVYRLQR